VLQKLNKKLKRSVGRPKKKAHELKSNVIRERVTQADKTKIENYLVSKSLSITDILKKYIDANP
jgi:hypothetical protein